MFRFLLIPPIFVLVACGHRAVQTDEVDPIEVQNQRPRVAEGTFAKPGTAVLLQTILARHPVTKSVPLGSATCHEVVEPSVLIPKGPSADKIYCNETYCAQYSPSLNLARWVAYETSPLHFNESVAVSKHQVFTQGQCPVTASPQIFQDMSQRPGHLMPVEDSRFAHSALGDNFLMTNIVPQNPRLKNTWDQIEQYVRNRESNELRSWIVTGPIISTKHAELREHAAIPAKFFKVILSEERDHSMAAYGFLVDQTSEGMPWQFLATVDEIEKASGLDFFSDLPDDVENEIEAHLPLARAEISVKSPRQ